MRFWNSWRRDDRGATSVEYAVLLAAILMACIGAIRFFGLTVGTSINDSATQIQTYFPTGS